MLLVHFLVNCFAHRPFLEAAWRYNHLNMPEIVPAIFFPLSCASGKITKKTADRTAAPKPPARVIKQGGGTTSPPACVS
jgi:hypothetical protein